MSKSLFKVVTIVRENQPEVYGIFEGTKTWKCEPICYCEKRGYAEQLVNLLNKERTAS